MSDTFNAQVESLLVLQQHGFDTVSKTLQRLEPTLDPAVVTQLEAVQSLLHDGGDQAAVAQAYNDLVVTMRTLAVELHADDLALLNAVETDLLYMNQHMRTGDALQPLPDPVPQEGALAHESGQAHLTGREQRRLGRTTILSRPAEELAADREATGRDPADRMVRAQGVQTKEERDAQAKSDRATEGRDQRHQGSAGAKEERDHPQPPSKHA
jgi:hypothetical protein